MQTEMLCKIILTCFCTGVRFENLVKIPRNLKFPEIKRELICDKAAVTLK